MEATKRCNPRPRSFASWTLSFILATGATLSPLPLAAVPFEAAQNPWEGLFGNPGAVPDGNGNITIDTNGNGFIDPSDNTYPLPNDIQVAINYHLSPTRTILYASTSGTGSEVLLHWYEIPPQAAQFLIPIAVNVSIPHGVAHFGYFDKPAQSSQRLVYVADQESGGSTQQIIWVDLNSGTDATSQFPFSPNIGFVQFSPSGVAAFVQSDLSDGDNLADYTMVDLCTATLGSFYNTGGTLSQLGPLQAVADEVDQGGGDLIANVEQPAGTFRAQFDLDECGAPSPDTGACCLPSGGCIDGYTVADCAAATGTFQGIGSECETAACPPAPNAILGITKSGPASVDEGRDITYTLMYENTGQLDASGVLIVDTLPTGTSFVSATNGGIYGSFSNNVTWVLGTVAAGASSQVSLTVKVACGQGGSTVTNSLYSIFGNPGGVAGGPPVLTSVNTLQPAAINVAVSSTPQSPLPLSNLELVTQTISLQNTAAFTRRDVTFSVQYGSAARFDSLLDAGGGTVVPLGSQLSWTGDVPASGSVNLVFTTSIDECRSGSLTETILNHGFAFTVYNQCGAVVGTGTPTDVITLAPLPLASSLVATNLVAGIVPADNTFWGDNIALARPDQSVDFKFQLDNTESATQAVSVTIPIPPGLTPSGDPPFIGTPPPGATWDNGTNVIQWSDSLAGFETLCIEFRAVLASSACNVGMAMTGSSGNCSFNLNGSLTVFAVPQPPTTSYLSGLNPYGGLWTYTPIDSTQQTLICLVPEFFTGMDLAPNGDYWISGFPTLRFNPQTLEFQLFSTSFAESLGMDLAWDMAFDSSDNTLVVVGNRNVGGQDEIRVRRWNPQTSQVTAIFDDTSPPTYRDARNVEIDPEGFIAVATAAGVLRIDPASPGSEVLYADTLIADPVSLTLDHDGDYLVNDYIFGSGVPRNLAKIDRATGTFTLVSDLSQILPLSQPIVATVVGDSGDIYLGPNFGVPLVLDRQNMTLGFVAGPTNHADLEWTSLTPTDVAADDGDRPGNDALPRAAALRPNVPNPFNPRTVIHYDVAQAGLVRIEVFNMHGRLVARLVSAHREAGRYTTTFEARDTANRRLASGVYVVRLETTGSVRSRKLTLLK